MTELEILREIKRCETRLRRLATRRGRIPQRETDAGGNDVVDFLGTAANLLDAACSVLSVTISIINS